MATGGINARGGVPVRTGPMGGAAVPDPPPAREPPPPVTEVPDRIYDPSKRKTYVKGRFLGKVSGKFYHTRTANNNSICVQLGWMG